MTLKVSKEGMKVTIYLPELFAFSIRNEFKQAISGNPSGIQYVFDFRQVKKMDSSALGMLLLLRETSGGQQADIAFINMNSDIRRLMMLANFHTLFRFQ